VRKELSIALVLLAGTISLYLSLSLMEDPRAATFPKVIILIMGGLSMILLLQSVIAGPKKNKPGPQSDRVSAQEASASQISLPYGTLVGCFILIVIYFAVMERLGFYVSAFLFFVAVTLLLGRKDLSVRKGGMRVGIALIFTTILFVLFNQLLVVQTPKGLLF
jgi:hypothetical protein